jgi:hypothetical protein
MPRSEVVQAEYRQSSGRLHWLSALGSVGSVEAEFTPLQRRIAMKVIRLLSRFVAAALLCSSLAMAQSAGTENIGCSNATLVGSYAFQITGQILAPAPAPGPVAGVALTVFDGFGNLTQVDNVVHNGIVPVEDWRPAAGTYIVNANCTGTLNFTPQPMNPADAGPALALHFVVTRNGSQILTTVTGSPNTPPFVAAITSIGIRLY